MITRIFSLKILDIWGSFDPASLKSSYIRKMKEWHPDLRGETGLEMSKLINLAYESLKNDSDREGLWETKGYSRTDSRENPFDEALAEAIAFALNLSAGILEVEVCGTWIWLSGDTRPFKEELKEFGFSWSKGKGKWYWRHGKHAFRKRNSNKEFTMDEIRSRHGSRHVYGSGHAPVN